MNLLLNPKRTVVELKELRTLTGNEHGAQRVAFTPKWLEARAWLRNKLTELPVEVRTDAAGNLWATLRGASEKCLLIGGHIDSVPNGGWLDGCLNVMAGVEILRRINAQYDGKPPITVRLVDWADEEGARFGKSLFGSSACSGNLDMNEARSLVDNQGIKLPDALREVGVDFERVKESGVELKNAAAYIELHIEQGPVLLDLDLPLGAVLGTFGVERHAITFHGQAAHSGSTPMTRRKDAFLAAAKMSSEICKIAERSGNGVCTIGSCTTKPGIVTSVVEECRITLDQRHLDAAKLAWMLAEAKAASERFATEGGVKVSWERLWQIAPRPFNDELITLCDESIRETFGQSHKLPSGPLHDAAEVAAAGVPTVMMFVQSLHGISHNKIEDTKEEHLELCVTAFDKLAEKVMGWIGTKSSYVDEPTQAGQHLDEVTVTDYCNKFFGFGNCNAPVWFVGIEEAGGRTVQGVQNRLRVWHERGRKQWEDAPRFYPACGNVAWHGPNAVLQPTWKQLIRMLLLAQGRANTDEAILDYQRNHFGAAKGQTCLTELLPLPSPRTSVWNYDQWAALPWLQNRETYFQEWRGERVNELRRQITEHQPKVVIFYGLTLPGAISLLPSWSEIAGGFFDQAFPDQRILLQREGANTRFFVTRHPVAEGDEYFRTIGRFLHENYGALFK